jgi:ubiquinone biosynthesis protein UbiJ
MARNLVRVELTFVSEDDADAVGERIAESVRMIVGREALEEFRVRAMPLDPKKKDHLRPVD